MKITYTTDESDDTETYDSLEELEKELLFSAADDYTETVLNRIRAGERHVEIANGRYTDTYDISED